MERKIKRVEITPEVLVNMLKGGTWTITENPLPEDARLCGAGILPFDFDYKKGVVVLIVESETYEPVPVGEIIETAPLTVFKHMGD
jgi:hypothetical protein